MSEASRLLRMGRLQEQAALVTGANSGIGEAIAKALAAEGARVAVNYVVNKEEAERVVREIRGQEGEAIALYADISREDDVTAMFEKMKAEYGTVDILVNNAGIQRDAPFVDMSLGDWQKVIDVNLTGSFLCAREAAREFLRRGVVEGRSISAGKIIFVSSVHEIIPW